MSFSDVCKKSDQKQFSGPDKVIDSGKTYVGTIKTAKGDIGIYDPDRKLITAVNVFDVYEGKGIDETRKSIAIAVTLQPREKTLTDQEIDAVAAKIVAEVTKKTGGSLRA